LTDKLCASNYSLIAHHSLLTTTKIPLSTFIKTLTMRIRTLASVCLLLVAGSLFSQNTTPPLYVLYTPQNMDVLDYRTAYSSTSATYYAYALKSNMGMERALLYTGTGIYAQYPPNGMVSSAGFQVTDDIRNAVNSRQRKMYVVQQVQQGFYALEVTSITKVVRSGRFYNIQSPVYNFVLDTSNLVIGHQLALAGSESAVSLTSYGVRNCRNSYAFRRTPYQSGNSMADFEFIPGIGLTLEKSGRDASEMQANQIMLWGVNGLPLDDYLRQVCGSATPPPSSSALPPPPNPYGPSVQPEPRPGDQVAPGAVASYSSISNQPTVNCPSASRTGYHVVQPKETVNGIARFYGIDPKQLLQWNNIKNANQIAICQELRLTAPGMTPNAPTYTPPAGNPPAGTNMTVIQQQKGNSPVSNRIITLPAPTQPQQPYQPTQPTTPQPMPDMMGGGTAYPAPAPIPMTPAAPIATGIHLVQPKEGVYAIARRYGCTEESIRQLNGFPARGNVPLQVGQQVRICGTTAVGPQVPGTVPPAYVPPTSGNNTWTPPATTPQPPPTNVPATRMAIGWQDYQTRDNESLSDLALRRKYTAGEVAEIATLNGIQNVGAKLPNGTKLSLPIFENSAPDPGPSIPGFTPLGGGGTGATTPTTTPTANPTTTSGTSTADLPALYAPSTGNKQGFVPLGGNGTVGATPPTTTPSFSQTMPDELRVRRPIRWEFYYPKDAESLNEIGRKRQYTKNEVAEIATLNGIEKPEQPLPPGRKIELPVYNQ
jgi:LysM repeat protein